MKKSLKSKKPTFVSVINDVSDIKDLHDEFVKKGFTTQQAFELTQTVIKLVLT